MTLISVLSTKLLFASRRWALLGVLGGALLVARSADAQVQEERLNEILHADRTKTSDFAGKTFAASPAVGGKQARVHAFAFGHSAALRSGDGSFETHAFASKNTYRTHESFTKTDRVSNSESFALRDKGFATKALAVQEDRSANKSAAVRAYVPAEKSIVIRGKRQDTLDDIRKQRNPSIDEVREILNKPNGRPGAKPPTSVAPALRALPVASASVQ